MLSKKDFEVLVDARLIQGEHSRSRHVSRILMLNQLPVGHKRFGSHRLDEIRLRRVLDYIAENLEQDITVAQLASVACPTAR
jgi:transcriptional regulator GlxA family with amidase domain